MGSYVFDNGWERERERLAGLENVLDSGTTRYLDRIGVGAGWQCLEIGGGGGSVTRWLCQRVGSSGRVLATDLDTRFLDALDEPNLDVLHHDVAVDPLPESRFDLIHARLLLEHLPDREQIIKRLVTSLRPGGWVLFEDIDFRPFFAKPSAMVLHPASLRRRSTRVWRATLSVMQAAGYDAEFGARLPTLLLEAGLEECGAEAHSPMRQGGTPGSQVTSYSLIHLHDAIVATGKVSERELDAEIAGASDPERWMMWPPMISAWGRRSPRDEHTGAVTEPIADVRDTVDRLAHLPLFGGCPTDLVRRVAAMAQVRQVNQGTTLTREGDPGDEFYVVLRGSATVSIAGATAATLGPGSFFGETALLTGGPRTATVTADTAMTIAALDRAGFDGLLEQSPTVSRRIMQGVAERSTGFRQMWP